MTGNVKEWALARAANQDPIRGGGAASTEVAAACNQNTEVGTDTTTATDLGFRCCR
jgi:hypothetical protein